MEAKAPVFHRRAKEKENPKKEKRKEKSLQRAKLNPLTRALSPKAKGKENENQKTLQTVLPRPGIDRLTPLPRDPERVKAMEKDRGRTEKEKGKESPKKEQPPTTREKVKDLADPKEKESRKASETTGRTK